MFRIRKDEITFGSGTQLFETLVVPDDSTLHVSVVLAQAAVKAKQSQLREINYGDLHDKHRNTCHKHCRCGDGDDRPS
jgi:hypothetical protein